MKHSKGLPSQKDVALGLETNQAKPRIDKPRHHSCGGYNWDNGHVCFDRPGERRKKQQTNNI